MAQVRDLAFFLCISGTSNLSATDFFVLHGAGDPTLGPCAWQARALPLSYIPCTWIAVWGGWDDATSWLDPEVQQALLQQSFTDSQQLDRSLELACESEVVWLH
jgi:hypothetical protein